MFINQLQLRNVLNGYFLMSDNTINKPYFNESIQLILANDHDLYDAIRETNMAPAMIAFEAFKRFAQSACEMEYGDVLGLTIAMLVSWCNEHGSFSELAKATYNYIDMKRADARKEREENTMKNTENTIETLNTVEIEETEDIFCANCGCIITGEAHEVDGEHYCDDCFEAQFVECNDCGEIIPRDDARQGADGEWYCEDCFYDTFDYCEHCGDVVYKDDAYYDQRTGECYCEDCRDRFYTICDHCGEYMRDGRDAQYSVLVNDGDDEETWCEDCVENSAFGCDCCGDLYDSDDDHDRDRYLCPNCYRDRQDEDEGCDTGDINTWKSPRRRMEYGFKPAPCMCATESEKSMAGGNWQRSIVFYGFELEIDRREKCHREDEVSAQIVDALPNSYCKTDCSLNKGGSYSGIEIVSHPGTLAYHYAMKQKYEEAFEMLKEDGWLSHDAGTCGLHVHISLHALEAQNPFAVNNMLFLFDRFWNHLVKFSRRTEAQLDHWAKRYSTDHGYYEDIKNMAKRDRDRYMAVNLQNAHTVEIRMFRGTLNLQTFFATLQLVDVLCKRCVEIGNDVRRLQSITWTELVQSDHEELNAYLKLRGLDTNEIKEAERNIRQRAEETPIMIQPAPDRSDMIPGQSRFHVGDVVRVDLASNACAHDIPEEYSTGVVTFVENDHSYAVEFTHPTELEGNSVWLHNCDNHTTERSGRWTCADEMTLIRHAHEWGEGPFNIGSLVFCNLRADVGTHRLGDDVPGIVVDHSSSTGYPLVWFPDVTVDLYPEAFHNGNRSAIGADQSNSNNRFICARNVRLA